MAGAHPTDRGASVVHDGGIIAKPREWFGPGDVTNITWIPSSTAQGPNFFAPQMEGSTTNGVLFTSLAKAFDCTTLVVPSAVAVAPTIVSAERAM